jgi:xanthine dehydrogenase accessory factor
VTVASPAADTASFPQADQIITNYDASSATFSSAPLVVVATQGKGDQAALQAALRVDTFHRAFIASKRKADKLKQLLKEKGHDPQAVDGIIAPAGVHIGAISPEEIAVSVIAELIAARNAQMATPEELSVNNTATTAVAAAAPGQAVPAESSSSPVESGCCGSNTAT